MKLVVLKLVYIKQLIIIEMQIIHRYAGFYPFGLQKEPENTYVELLKQNLAEEDISHYRLKFKFFREMVLTHVLKLIKLSRENNNLRFLYQYQPLSLQRYLSQLSEDSNKRLETSVYKCLLHHFTTNIQEIIKELIHYQIKTDLLINNLAVSSNYAFPLKLKVFVEPQCYCFALQIFSEGKPEDFKDLIHQNKQSLIEFYANQKKKMIVQFEELMEIYFGKLQPEGYRPNFIINGVKLVFINQEETSKQTKNQNRERKKSTSSDKINFSSKYCPEKERRGSGQGNIERGIASFYQNKVEQTKAISNNKHQQRGSKNLSQTQNMKNGCFSIHFEPAEITKDRTMIVEQSEYLQSLQEEIKNMQEQQRLNSKQMTRTSPGLHINKIITPVSTQQPQDKMANNQPKSQKTHKYKMKIITSHDVEIEEEKDPQIIEVNHQNFNKESSDLITSSNKQLCIQNNSQKVDNQYSYQQKEQAPEKRLFQTRYSDGDTFLLKKQIGGKPIVSSVINPDEPQNSNKCCCCKAEPYRHQNEKKQPLVENYLIKVQSAKEKAQKLLRQYAQNKIKRV